MRVTLETESQIATKDSVLGEDAVEAVLGVDEDGTRGAQSAWRVGPPKADADAQDKIPVAWNVSKFQVAHASHRIYAESESALHPKTPDRILDVFLLKPAIQAIRRQALQNPSGTSKDSLEKLDFRSLVEDGVKPADDLLVTVEVAERMLKRKFTRNDAEEMVNYVGWAYVKWQDLQYEAGAQTSGGCKMLITNCRYVNPLLATWDTPILAPAPGSTAFLGAFEAYLWSRTVIVPVLKPVEALKRDNRPLNGFVRMAKQPSCVVGGVSAMRSL
jgi:hypothetical protein